MKLGLVLEGGASRTTFSCGVMDILLDENIIADYVIGTSAGIAFGVSYVSHQRGRNLRIATEYMGDPRYMGVRHFLNPKNKGYYNMDFVYGDIPNKHIPFDMKAFKEFKGDVIGVCTNVATGQAEYLQVDRDDNTFQVLRASCALPILFPRININGVDYLDGGISDSIPFQKAINDGCDKVIVVLTRPRGYIKKTDKTVRFAGLAYRNYPEFVKSMIERSDKYNKQIKELRRLEREGKVFVIEPITTMDVGRTEKRAQKLFPLYVHGKNVCEEKIELLKEYINN